MDDLHVGFIQMTTEALALEAFSEMFFDEVENSNHWSRNGYPHQQPGDLENYGKLLDG